MLLEEIFAIKIEERLKLRRIGERYERKKWCSVGIINTFENQRNIQHSKIFVFGSKNERVLLGYRKFLRFRTKINTKPRLY